MHSKRSVLNQIKFKYYLKHKSKAIYISILHKNQSNAQNYMLTKVIRKYLFHIRKQLRILL